MPAAISASQLQYSELYRDNLEYCKEAIPEVTTGPRSQPDESNVDGRVTTGYSG